MRHQPDDPDLHRTQPHEDALSVALVAVWVACLAGMVAWLMTLASRW